MKARVKLTAMHPSLNQDAPLTQLLAVVQPWWAGDKEFLEVPMIPVHRLSSTVLESNTAARGMWHLGVRDCVCKDRKAACRRSLAFTPGAMGVTGVWHRVRGQICILKTGSGGSVEDRLEVAQWRQGSRWEAVGSLAGRCWHSDLGMAPRRRKAGG
jgi:hypothetical protein